MQFLATTIQVVERFPELHRLLVSLLRSLTDEEWALPTIAGKWTVKDVAAHLLDGYLRTLSIQRDRYFGAPPPFAIDSFGALVEWLNALNAEWVQAARRLSPKVITALLEATGDDVCAYYASLAPFEPAIFAVDWAGESVSMNWIHLAREYSEQWHHQQQIREAVGQTDALMSRALFFPCIDALMRALPRAYHRLAAPEGALVEIRVTGDAGGIWRLQRRENSWRLVEESSDTALKADAVISLPPETAWKLFTRGITPQEAQSRALMHGDKRLAEPLFAMISVMAEPR
jgi:uncharacterized protein (TIGR03083 family)